MNPTQTKSLRQKLKLLLPYLTIPLILFVCYALWVNLPEEQFASAYSNNATWDLRDIDFENATASLRGRVEFIPAPFLTPEEFAAREDEIIMGYPHVASDPATIRLRILVPDDNVYVITRTSTGYADRIYINGEWLRDIGSPLHNNILLSPTIAFTAKPQNGVIEILHQQSNFIYRVHGVYREGILDEYTYGNAMQRATFTTNVMLGIFLAMAMVSLMLFLLLHNYRPALYFALLCLVWFAYTGISGANVFTSLAPWYVEPARFRLIFVSSPLTGVLMAAIIREILPGVLHRYFIRAVIIVFSCWSVYFMFADIGFILSHALWICLGMAAVSFLWLLFSFAKNLRKPNIYQSIYALGIVFLSYAALRDIFTYIPLHIGNLRLLLPPFDGINLARVGVIACLLCQAAAIFIATMREMEKSKNEAQENSIKNAASENLAKMRRNYLADMSHEMNHPLTVVSVHVQQAARRYAKSGGDDEVISNSLLLAQKEIMNATHIAKSSLKLATSQIDKEQKGVLETSTFLSNYLEGYRAIIERTGNKLTLNIPENIPHVFVNASQLGQVLMNLLTNAYTHTKNGVITVTVESKAQMDGGCVTVTVEDNGTGIPPEILAHVFERGISSSGGTGLGLPISKDIIESHGGVLNIKSEPNKGVAVTFTIPVYNEGTAKDGDGDE